MQLLQSQQQNQGTTTPRKSQQFPKIQIVLTNCVEEENEDDFSNQINTSNSSSNHLSTSPKNQSNLLVNPLNLTQSRRSSFQRRNSKQLQASNQHDSLFLSTLVNQKSNVNSSSEAGSDLKLRKESIISTSSSKGKLPFNRRHSLAVNNKFNLNSATGTKQTNRKIKSNTSKKSAEKPKENDLISVEGPFKRISVTKNSSNVLKLGSVLSKVGSCAVLKAYEDELYKNIKIKCPYEPLPRISTPEFNSKFSRKHSIRTISDDFDFQQEEEYEEDEKEEDNADEDRNKLIQHKINKQIDTAMQILDDLSNSTSTQSPSTLFMQNSDEMNEIIRKYENWHLKWSKMLNDIF